MGKRLPVMVIVFALFFVSSTCFGETILLKSGQEIKGTILVKTEKFITIESLGLPLTYSIEEVESIDGQAIASFERLKKDLFERDPVSDDPEKRKIAEEILVLSGFKKQIGYYPGILEQELAGVKQNQKPEVYEQVSKVMIEAFSAERIYQVALDNLIARFDKERYLMLLSWFRSPLSRKISALEEQASTPEAVEVMKEFSVSLQSHPPREEKIALLKELDQAVQATQFSIDLAVVLNLQLFKAFDATVPEDRRILRGEWESKFKAHLQSQLEHPMKLNTLNTCLYVYRDVSDDELLEYLNFWKSPDGQWCSKLMTQAVLYGIAQVGKDVGNRVSDIIPK